MNSFKKYGIVFLSTMLMLSLFASLCCHTATSTAGVHQQQILAESSHDAHHAASDCKCGHEFFEDFQKKDNRSKLPDFSTFSSSTLLGMSAAFNRSSILFRPVPDFIYEIQAPPLYLLNSVFLN